MACNVRSILVCDPQCSGNDTADAPDKAKDLTGVVNIRRDDLVQLQQSQPNGQEAHVNVWASTQLLGPQINGSDAFSSLPSSKRHTEAQILCVVPVHLGASLLLCAAPIRPPQLAPSNPRDSFLAGRLAPRPSQRLATLTGGPRTLPLSTPQHAAGPASCLAALHGTASSIISVPLWYFKRTACQPVMVSRGRQANGRPCTAAILVGYARSGAIMLLPARGLDRLC